MNLYEKYQEKFGVEEVTQKTLSDVVKEVEQECLNRIEQGVKLPYCISANTTLDTKLLNPYLHSVGIIATHKKDSLKGGDGDIVVIVTGFTKPEKEPVHIPNKTPAMKKKKKEWKSYDPKRFNDGFHSWG